MKKSTILLLFISLFMLFGCQNKAKKEKNTISSILKRAQDL